MNSTDLTLTTPSFWVPAVLGQVLRYRRLQFELSGHAVDIDEMVDALGYGSLLAVLVNLRVPGSIPIIPNEQSCCRWQALYDEVQLPVALIGAAILDLCYELEAQYAPQAVPLASLYAWMDTALNPSNPLSGVMRGTTCMLPDYRHA